MARTQVQVFASRDALYRTAAEIIAGTLVSALRRHHSAAFVLSGGTTPGPLYSLLAAPPLRSMVDWPKVHFFWGDERCVPPEDPLSNYGMARRSLLSGIDPPADRVHRIEAELPDSEEAAARYESEIGRVLAGNVSFDLVLLGMGGDGHTASLFPGTSWPQDRLVVPNDPPPPGIRRITLTPRALNNSDLVVFLVAGADKAAALADVLEGGRADLPAARIRPEHGRVIWLTDKDAAARLRQHRG